VDRACDVGGTRTAPDVRLGGQPGVASQRCAVLGDPPAAPLVPVATREVADPCGLAAVAAEVAARQRSPETRRIYAAVCRAFAAFLGRARSQLT
jgi:hypothetical protein